MREDPHDLTDTKLSAAEVTRVLERAVQLDATLQAPSVADLAAAAREAGISEQAVFLAVQELLEDRQSISTVDPGRSASSGSASRIKPWLVGVTSGVSLLIGLMVIFFVLRLLVSR
jgi:hypothetical protein